MILKSQSLCKKQALKVSKLLMGNKKDRFEKDS
jgi:hypothetical protein